MILAGSTTVVKCYFHSEGVGLDQGLANTVWCWPRSGQSSRHERDVEPCSRRKALARNARASAPTGRGSALLGAGRHGLRTCYSRQMNTYFPDRVPSCGCIYFVGPIWRWVPSVLARVCACVVIHVYAAGIYIRLGVYKPRSSCVLLGASHHVVQGSDLSRSILQSSMSAPTAFARGCSGVPDLLAFTSLQASATLATPRTSGRGCRRECSECAP
jgi:hypothetical protein